TLKDMLRRRSRLDDVEVTVGLLNVPDQGAVLSVGSGRGLLDAPRAAAAEQAAATAGMDARPVFTYLANRMRSGDHEIPYSLVTAMDLDGLIDANRSHASTGAPPIVLNEWAARDLGARTGDPLTLEYYVWQEPGQLLTRTANFQITAVIPIKGAA